MRWKILAVLFAVSFIAYVLRINLSVAQETMQPELGLDARDMGLVFGAFTLGYTLFQLPGGLFGEWLGARRALAWIVIGWGIVTLLTGGLPGAVAGTGAAAFGVLLVLRFAMGVVQAPLYPIFSGTIERWFPVAGWALPQGLTSTGLALGAAAAQPLVAAMIAVWGWQFSFYATVPFAFALAALWWWYGRDDPASHPGVDSGELALIRANRRPPLPAEAERRVWLRMLANRNVQLISVSYLCMNYVFYIFFNWVYAYLVRERGFELLEAGFLAALPWLVGAAAATIGGASCDTLCRRIGPRWGCRLPCVAGLSLVAVFLLVGAYSPGPYFAVLFLSLCFAFTQFTEGAYWSGTTFVAGEHTAVATGILNTGGNLGGVISGPLIPILVDKFGWIAALSTGSLFALLGAILWLFVRVDEPFAASDTE